MEDVRAALSDFLYTSITLCPQPVPQHERRRLPVPELCEMPSSDLRAAPQDRRVITSRAVAKSGPSAVKGEILSRPRLTEPVYTPGATQDPRLCDPPDEASRAVAKSGPSAVKGEILSRPRLTEPVYTPGATQDPRLCDPPVITSLCPGETGNASRNATTRSDSQTRSRSPTSQDGHWSLTGQGDRRTPRVDRRSVVSVVSIRAAGA